MNIYIINESFQPNSATTNRFLTFAKGYGELGIDVKVLFVSQNKGFIKSKIIN